MLAPIPTAARTDEGGLARQAIPAVAARGAEDLRIVAARACACVLVIVVHVAGWQFYQFSSNWWASNVYDSVARVAVPLFFMMSGALLLRKDEPLRDFLRKRPLRLALPLAFWSLAYLAFYKAIGQGRAHGGWLKTILGGPVEVHLWYLYAALGLYAFLPLLRKMFLGASEAEKRYYLLLWFACAVAYPTWARYAGQAPSLVDVYYLQNFTGYAGYFFLGAYLHERTHRPGWRVPALWFALCSAATMLLTYAYSRRIGAPDELFYGYLTPSVALAAAAAFSLFLALELRPAARMVPLLQRVSDNSLGIYCVHLMIMQTLAWKQWIFTGAAWWTVPANVGLIFLPSFLVTAALRAVPPLRQVA